MTTEERVLKALQEVYELTKTKGGFSMTKVLRKHRVQLNVSKVLANGGIIKNTGSRRKPNWEWTVDVIPNIAMANKTVAESEALHVKSLEGKKKELEPQASKNVEPRPVVSIPKPQERSGYMITTTTTVKTILGFIPWITSKTTVENEYSNK